MTPPGTHAGDSTPPRAPVSPAAAELKDSATGLPGFRTWRAVYWFVFVAFVVWVLLLAWLGRAFR